MLERTRTAEDLAVWTGSGARSFPTRIEERPRGQDVAYKPELLGPPPTDPRRQANLEAVDAAPVGARPNARRQSHHSRAVLRALKDPDRGKQTDWHGDDGAARGHQHCRIKFGRPRRAERCFAIVAACQPGSASPVGESIGCGSSAASAVAGGYDAVPLLPVGSKAELRGHSPPSPDVGCKWPGRSTDARAR